LRIAGAQAVGAARRLAAVLKYQVARWIKGAPLTRATVSEEAPPALRELASSLMLWSMSEATRILDAAARGDPQAAAQLLPLVYDELRRLAAARLAREQPGQTLDATALVHEAWLRLVQSPLAPSGGEGSGVRGGEGAQFANRRHFFAAAAEAMRRILVDRARERNSLKRGGDRRRLRFDQLHLEAEQTPAEFLAMHETLARLEALDPRKAELVKLRFFAGLTNQQAADALGISSSTADNDWAYARAWLRLEMESD
jgi:RNA polymerase sigma factor (sigma-70 family)